MDSAIRTLNGGFILLEGPPGSGKSTYLSEFRKRYSVVRFAYYCFVPDEVALGNPRLEKETFLKSLCVGIRNSFPTINFPEPYSENYAQILPMWLHRLSELGDKIVFIIDGLDHVDKKKESLTAPLTHYLEGTLLISHNILAATHRTPSESLSRQSSKKANPYSPPYKSPVRK